MAKDYPNSQFTGVDISFVASDTARPDNVDFKNANITKEIPFEDNSVDYYFQRFLVAGLNKEDMKAALKNAYRVVKPGGHIEIGEALIETVENTGPRYTPVRNMMAAVLKKKGLSPDIGLEIGDFLTEVGFENVHFDKKTVPVNHTNRAGELWWGDFAELFRSIRPVVAMSIPAYEDPEVYEGFIQAVKEECAEYKTNAIFCFAYGQKPLEESA
ncbi:hypothetical protein BDB01DRAFT_801780 [Pilobolus umbonatus]|nr:hypothetical protein BDB01DRAFT_801780 [Pilobolus umbonatus]